MSAEPSPRPWYCIDALVDDYVTIHQSGGDLKMYKGLKILRSIVVNAGIIGITTYALQTGADATIVATIGLLTLGLYNGIEIADYQALAQAIVEVSQESVSEERDD